VMWMILPLSYCDVMIQTRKQRYVRITGSSFSLWKVFYRFNSTVSDCIVSVGHAPGAD
jgi:hypothetical protein